MIRVNVCGKTEDKLEDGFCRECGSVCKMTEELMLDKRIYDYAKKRRLLVDGHFSSEKIKLYLENHPCIEQEPKYIRNYAKQICS